MADKWTRKGSSDPSSIQRWQCPIYNGTLETLIWSEMWKIIPFFLTTKVFIFQFCRENINENKHFKETKTLEIKNVLDHTKDFQGKLHIAIFERRVTWN